VFAPRVGRGLAETAKPPFRPWRTSEAVCVTPLAFRMASWVRTA